MFCAAATPSRARPPPQHLLKKPAASHSWALKNAAEEESPAPAMPDTLTPLPPDLLESDANLTEEERAAKELLKKRAESKVSVTERNQQKVSSMMRDAITEGRKTLSERRKVKQQMPETLSRLREYRDSTAERRRNSLLERQKRHTYVQSNPLITFITFISSSNVPLPQLRGGHPEPDC